MKDYRLGSMKKKTRLKISKLVKSYDQLLSEEYFSDAKFWRF